MRQNKVIEVTTTDLKTFKVVEGRMEFAVFFSSWVKTKEYQGSKLKVVLLSILKGVNPIKVFKSINLLENNMHNYVKYIYSEAKYNHGIVPISTGPFWCNKINEVSQ